MTVMRREVAWRIFAAEYNNSTFEYSDGGEKSPTYIITSLGAKVNRLFVVGVVTEIQNIGTETEPMWRARLSDPTGVYHLSAGRFQPDAATALSKINPPEFVAVIGKSRVYSPEPGVMYVSIRPEIVKTVDARLRDYWIIEASKSLKTRIEAMREAQMMEPPTVEELTKLGYSQNLAEGIVAALDHYGEVDLDWFSGILVESLEYVLPEYHTGEYVGKISKGTSMDKVDFDVLDASGYVPDIEEIDDTVEGEDSDGYMDFDSKDEDSSGSEDSELTEKENRMLNIVKSLSDGEEGAYWADMVDACKKIGMKDHEIESVCNKLQANGSLYEPVTGKFRVLDKD